MWCDVREEDAALHRESPRISPQERERPLIRQISPNCVIPKRVVDRLNEFRVRRARKNRARGWAVREAGGREGGEDDALSHHTRILHTHAPPSRPAQYREPFLPSWQLRHVAATTKAPRFLLPPPFRPPVRCNTQHLHTMLISCPSISWARVSPLYRMSWIN